MKLHSTATAVNWAALEDTLGTKQKETGFDAAPDLVNGPTSPFSMKRLFGTPEADVRVKFYRDHAAWCPYCQRIWLMLEEKQIPYVVEKIAMRCYGDKPQSFLSKVRSGLLPVIEIDGRIITESAEIMETLDAEFPENPMFPTDPQLQKAAYALLRLERDAFGLWCGWLFRPSDKRGEQRNQKRFEEALAMIDGALEQIGGGGPFFLGSEVSLIDFMMVPFLERYNASLLYWKGYKLRGGGYPNIDRWFEALEQRSTYSATQSDHYTHCHDIPPQYGPGYAAENTVAFAKAINGKDGETWRLPLPPITPESLEYRTNIVDGGLAEIYRVQAATKLITNHDAVTKFCLRAKGTPGKHFTAALADPYAKPNLDYEGPVAAALALTAHALLEGTDAAEGGVGAAEWLGADAGTRAESAEAVRECLGYMRDRVGVPRDMQLPAARQLRAHLNWAIDLAEARV